MMSSLKKKLHVLLVVVFAVVSLAGCTKTETKTTETAATTESTTTDATTAAEAEKKAIVVGVALNAMDEYVTNWIALFTEQIEAQGGKVVTTNAESNVSKQISDVDTLISQQPDIILIRPIDSQAAAPAGEAVKNAGIPLIVVDGSIPDLDYGISLVVDQGVNGKLLGEYMNKWLDEDTTRVANVGYIVGMYLDIVMPRMNEIFTTCPRAVKVIEAQGDWNADKGMKITEDWLQAHPEINVIAAMNDEMAIGAIQALKAAGKNLEDYLILGVDGSVNGQSYIKTGELDATTYSVVSEQVTQVAEATVIMANGGTYDKQMDPSSVKLMTKDNIEELITK